MYLNGWIYKSLPIILLFLLPTNTKFPCHIYTSMIIYHAVMHYLEVYLKYIVFGLAKHTLVALKEWQKNSVCSQVKALLTSFIHTMISYKLYFWLQWQVHYAELHQELYNGNLIYQKLKFTATFKGCITVIPPMFRCPLNGEFEIGCFITISANYLIIWKQNYKEI